MCKLSVGHVIKYQSSEKSWEVIEIYKSRFGVLLYQVKRLNDGVITSWDVCNIDGGLTIGAWNIVHGSHKKLNKSALEDL